MKSKSEIKELKRFCKYVDAFYDIEKDTINDREYYIKEGRLYFKDGTDIYKEFIEDNYISTNYNGENIDCKMWR